MPDICSHPSLHSSHECCRQSDAYSHGDGCPFLVFCFVLFCQGDTVAAPVPVFDCRTRNWSRPTLERGSVPFLRKPPAGSTAHSYTFQPPSAATTSPGFRADCLGAGEAVAGATLAQAERQADASGNTMGYIVTDDVLLAHLKVEVIAVSLVAACMARVSNIGPTLVRPSVRANGSGQFRWHECDSVCRLRTSAPSSSKRGGHQRGLGRRKSRVVLYFAYRPVAAVIAWAKNFAGRWNIAPMSTDSS